MHFTEASLCWRLFPHVVDVFNLKNRWHLKVVTNLDRLQHGWNCKLKIKQLEIKKGHLRFIESETLLFQSTASLIEIWFYERLWFFVCGLSSFLIIISSVFIQFEKSFKSFMTRWKCMSWIYDEKISSMTDFFMVQQSSWWWNLCFKAWYCSPLKIRWVL